VVQGKGGDGFLELFRVDLQLKVEAFIVGSGIPGDRRREAHVGEALHLGKLGKILDGRLALPPENQLAFAKGEVVDPGVTRGDPGEDGDYLQKGVSFGVKLREGLLVLQELVDAGLEFLYRLPLGLGLGHLPFEGFRLLLKPAEGVDLVECESGI